MLQPRACWRARIWSSASCRDNSGRPRRTGLAWQATKRPMGSKWRRTASMRWSWRHVVLACAATGAALWLLSAGLAPAAADPDSMAPNPPAEPPPPPGASSVDRGPPVGADSFKAVEGDGGGGGGNFGNPGGSSGGPNVEIPGLLPNDQSQGPSISPDEIIVVLPGTLDRSAGAAFAADHNSTVVDYFQLPGLNAHVFLLSLRDASQFGQRFRK